MAPTADRDDRRPRSGKRAYRPDAAGGSRPRPMPASSGPARPWSLDLGLSPPPPGRSEARGPALRPADLGGGRTAGDATGNAP